MGHRDKVDRRRARREWERLVDALEQAGAVVELLEPSPLSPPLVFTADTAFPYAPGRALVLRNDGPRGIFEPDVVRSWLRERGYTVEPLPPRYRLDGGNLLRLPSGDVVAGLKPGANGRAERYLGHLLDKAAGRKLRGLQLVDERHLHLDTAVGVLGDRGFLVYPGALAAGRIPRTGPLAEAEVVEVDREDAARFACNIVVVGDVLLTGLVSDGLVRRIGRLGFHVERLDLGEFIKAGGGAKCLTLRLDPPATEGGTDGE